MWTLERFVSDCREAVDAGSDHTVIKDIMARAMADPMTVSSAFGTPDAAGITLLYHAPNLTILNVVWKPGMTVQPHDHNMWATIGIYEGREDNIFWRRIEGDPDGTIEAAGARSLGAGEFSPLGRNIIHSVTNPLSRLTGAIHVYGGDFFAAERSEWDPENLHEAPLDIERVKAIFSD